MKPARTSRLQNLRQQVQNPPVRLALLLRSFEGREWLRGKNLPTGRAQK